MVVSVIRERIMVLLATLGVAVALLSGLSQHLDWVSNLCSFFGEGCRDTSLFAILGIRVWMWGVAFYVGLIGFALFLRRVLFWLVITGTGMELSFVWIMASEKVVCVFCLVNLVVMLLLFLLAFERQRLWQMVAMVSVFLLLGLVLVQKEPTTQPVNVDIPVIAEPIQPEVDVVARVGDRTITSRDLEIPLLMRLHDLEMQGYRLKRERLEQMIAQIVIEREAARQGIPMESYIDQTILSNLPEPTQEEIDQYLRDNPSLKTNWRGTPEDLDRHVRAVLQQRKSYQMVMDKARSMYAQEGVVITLKEPELPRVQVNLADAAIQGPPEAPVTVVEFSDYQCPACRRNHETIKKILETYQGRIRYVFKDFPLRSHRWAAKAAEGARCAGEQHKFFQFQNMLFSSDQELTPDQMEVYALEMGLDAVEFRKCLDSGKHRSAVEKSIEDGRSIGVNSTPTLVVNGRIITGGQSTESLSKLIEEELQRKQGSKP